MFALKTKIQEVRRVIAPNSECVVSKEVALGGCTVNHQSV